jgi:SPP1 gp7 family putative phage head morphogenesis protein
MKLRTIKLPILNAKPKKRSPNPLRADPTRTAGLRRRFLADLNKRFLILKKRLWKLIVTDDAFGLRVPTVNYDPDEARDEAGRWTAGGGGQTIGLHGSMQKYWALKDYQERWIKEGIAKIVVVPINELISREGEDIHEVNLQGFKVLGIIKEWNADAKMYLPEGVSKPDGHVKIDDGRFRIAAWMAQGKKEVPIVVANNSLVTHGGAGSGDFGHSGRPGEVGGSGNSSPESPTTTSELRKVNNGIGSLYDDETFYEKAILPLHNSNTLKPLEKFAEKLPNRFARVQTVMRFNAWRDSNVKEPFLDWLQHGTVTIYRGIHPESKEEKASWTLSPKIADVFSRQGAALGVRQTEGVSGGRVVSRQIPVKGIWAYSDAQGEQEVILKEYIHNRLTTNESFKFLSTPEQVEAFRKWLAQQTQYLLIGSSTEAIEKAFWDQYIEEGFKQGAGRAFDDMKKPALTATEEKSVSDFYHGTKTEFLQSAFGQKEAKEKVQILSGRVYTELKGVTEAMSQGLTRELTDGLVKGANPRAIGREIAKKVDGIGRTRADTIAMTEIARAHSQGQLLSYRKMGVQKLGVMVEFLTAQDDGVCDECSDLEGQTFDIDKADDVIPVHPRCRCCWLPANVGEDDEDEEDQVGEVADSEEKPDEEDRDADKKDQEDVIENQLVVHGGKGSGDFGHSGRPGEIGGSSAEFSPDKFYMGELLGGKLIGERLRNLMHPDNPSRARLLDTMAGLFSQDDTNAKLRKMMSDLAGMAVKGDILEHLHPGEGTYHRGGEVRGVRMSASSHSRDAKYAKLYGKVSSVKITEHTPAIDLDKMSFKPQYKEVLIDLRKLTANWNWWEQRFVGNFDPDEPRDESGRWTSGEGSVVDQDHRLEIHGELVDVYTNPTKEQIERIFKNQNPNNPYGDLRGMVLSGKAYVWEPTTETGIELTHDLIGSKVAGNSNPPENSRFWVTDKNEWGQPADVHISAKYGLQDSPDVEKYAQRIGMTVNVKMTYGILD